MLKKLWPTLLFALLLPGSAAAQNWQSGVYLELRAGATFLDDTDIEDDPLLDEIETDAGWLVDAAVGYAHETGLRGELALGFRQHQIDQVTIGSSSVDAEGDVSNFSIMANGYYDFYLSKYGARGAMANLSPFIGGGVGVAVISVEFDELGGTSVDDDRDGDSVFAYQGIAGLSYHFTRNVSASVSYAYFATSDPDFDGSKGEYSSHNVMAGLRYTF